MTFFAERVTLLLPWLLEIQNKFATLNTVCDRCLIHSSPSRWPFQIQCLQFPSITQQQSLFLSPTPIAVSSVYVPLFPVGSLPYETGSHRLQCSKYPPPRSSGGDLVNLWPGQFHCCLPFLDPLHFLGLSLTTKKASILFPDAHYFLS